ncbi:MAG: hypothetical protein ACRYGK_03765 [Janthinobacterium lividum]
MVILALDLGTTSGWALINQHRKIEGGSESFAPRKNEGPGQRWLRFRAWLSREQQHAGEINVVYYETVMNHTAVQAAHVYGGFEATLQAWCASNRVRMIGVGVGTIKKDWTGNGAAKKEQMIAQAKERGFKPVDDNHADALALLAYAIKAEGVTASITEPGPAALFKVAV